MEQFKKTIWNYYKEHKRSFVWRHEPDPYKILISEVMLQQTQTYRVVPKYEQFVAKFPTIESLADATLLEVLKVWQGLGYNRRAKFLHLLAQKVVNDHQGTVPFCRDTLQTLPGIGWATAGSICAFAFNQPTVFIETNIRTVYIHFFGQQRTEIKDKELLPIIAATVDQENPREWYYALMDYGVMLKSTQPNPSRKSAHHTKQSRFEGSDRQIRGMILKLLTQHEVMSIEKLVASIDRPPERVIAIMNDLIGEGLAKLIEDNLISIA